MPSQLAPGQPVFQLQATQALARAAEWGGKTPPSLGNLRGGCFASVLRRALELWAGHPGAFWGSVSQILVCKIPVCRQLLNKSLRLKKPEKPESSRGKPAGLQGVLSVAFGTPRAHGTHGLLLPH